MPEIGYCNSPLNNKNTGFLRRVTGAFPINCSGLTGAFCINLASVHWRCCH
jgi:hypothetical protein